MPPASPNRRHSAPGAIGKGKQKAAKEGSSMGPPSVISKGGGSSKSTAKTHAQVVEDDAAKLRRVNEDIAQRKGHLVSEKSASGTPFNDPPPSVSAKSAASSRARSASAAPAKAPKRGYRQRGRATSRIEATSPAPEIKPRDAFLKALALDPGHGLDPPEVEMMCHGMETVIAMKTSYLATVDAQIKVSREQCRLLKMLKEDVDETNKLVYLDSLKAFMVHQGQLEVIMASTAYGCAEIDRRMGVLLDEISTHSEPTIENEDAYTSLVEE